MSRLTLAVLFGGASSEHEVSLVSGASVLRHVPRVAMHPSVNTATVVLAFDELERIIRQNGNRIYYKEFQ